MHESTIAFIGAGNMAARLIGGLTASQVPPALVPPALISPERILASDPNTEKLARLESTFGIRTHPNNANIAKQASVILLAVKPQKMREALSSIATQVPNNALIISIAAGITLNFLQAELGEGVAIIRCMPNTPALVSEGITGMFANSHTTEIQKKLAESIMNAVGTILWVSPESKLDAVTAVSGSGPAYFFLLMECLQQAAQSLGLTEAEANTLVVKTALGAAKMALLCDEHLADLRQQVTSPGGTTEKALSILADNHFNEIIQKAVLAAHTRSRELASDMP